MSLPPAATTPAATAPATPPPDHDALQARLRRIRALVRKETKQILRDPSSVALGILLPVVLILLYGYGLSLDIRNVPIALVLEDPSPTARDLVGSFVGSPYSQVVPTTSMHEAETLMLDRKVDAILRIPPDFSRRLEQGNAEIQIVVHGTDANHARLAQGYAQGTVATWLALQSSRGHPVAAGPVVVRSRMWFNEANDSHYFLVPGLIVLIMTLIGAFLTAMVMAREWERGTLEALFVTPVKSGEILLGKVIPYFGLGMIGFILCMLASQVLFAVPFRGSILVLALASMLYLLVALGFGLYISSKVRSQFVASQIALLGTYLPALMLSGFLFDLRSMPVVVRMISYVVPARYYVAILQTVFLAGDIWTVILPNTLVLIGFGLLLLFLLRRSNRKSLG